MTQPSERKRHRAPAARRRAPGGAASQEGSSRKTRQATSLATHQRFAPAAALGCPEAGEVQEHRTSNFSSSHFHGTKHLLETQELCIPQTLSSPLASLMSESNGVQPQRPFLLVGNLPSSSPFSAKS